jgi:predicted ABC-type ATPase
MSKMRVLERVAHGGHNIPVSAIERRFPRSLYNLLTEYSYLASTSNPLLYE